MAAVVLTASPVSAEAASGTDLVTDGRTIEGERAQPARTTTAAVVERPVFADTACPWLTDSVVRLYSAYFLRAPDEGGFLFWLDEYSSGNWSLPEMSTFFSESQEFLDMYGGVTDAEFIDLIYRNIFGRQADEAGRDYWLGRMVNEGLGRGGVMLFFSESPEYIEQSGSFQPLAGEFNWYPEGTEWFCGFGDLEAAFSRPMTYVDLVIYNYSSRPVTLSINEQQNGVWDPSGSVSLDGDHFLYFFGLEWDLAVSTGVQVTGTDDFIWMLVYSPVPTPQERSGWVPI